MVSSSQLEQLAVVLFLATATQTTDIVVERTCVPPALKVLTDAELSALNASNSSQPPSELLTRFWCENNTTNPAAGNYINVTFPRKVVIYGFATRGRCGGDGGAFVRRFTVAAQTDEDENLRNLMQVSAEQCNS